METPRFYGHVVRATFLFLKSKNQQNFWSLFDLCFVSQQILEGDVSKIAMISIKPGK